MEPIYTWIKIGRDLKKKGCCQTRIKPNKDSIIDIMGVPSKGCRFCIKYVIIYSFVSIYVLVVNKRYRFCMYVASNFRFSKDKLTNSRVVDNYLKLFDLNAKCLSLYL